MNKLIVILLAVFVFFSCKKDDDNGIELNFHESLIIGSWKVVGTYTDSALFIGNNISEDSAYGNDSTFLHNGTISYPMPVNYIITFYDDKTYEATQDGIKWYAGSFYMTPDKRSGSISLDKFEGSSTRKVFTYSNTPINDFKIERNIWTNNNMDSIFVKRQHYDLIKK